MTAVLSILAATMNAAMTNGTDDDALPRVVTAASEAAMRNGMDNNALLRVLPAAMEAVMTNGTDDDALPRVPATDVVIVNNRGPFCIGWIWCCLSPTVVVTDLQ